MIDILRELYRRLYGSGTMAISLEIASLNINTSYKIHDYQFYDNKQTMELNTEDGTTITFDIADIEKVTRIDDIDREYEVISNKGWKAFVSFI